MKALKVIFITLIIMLTTSCAKTNEYDNIVNKLKLINIENKEEYPFNLEINIEKITSDELLYSFTLDNIKEDMYDINAIIIHDKKTNDIFPSIGIVDTPLTLTSSSKEKGLNLVGYINYEEEVNNFKANFKVKIIYKDKDNIIKTYYYIKQY